MAQPEYEAMIRGTGFQPGWHVLDAGCGSGGFLPLLAELVGPSGAVTAVDLAPENVATVRERLSAWDFPVPIDVAEASVLALPYPDDTFDGLWCASVFQYLSDDEVLAALAEFRRVVRPGGLIVVKDIDSNLMRFPVRVRGMIQHLGEARARAGSGQAHGAARGPELRSMLRRAGLADVSLQTTLVERLSPYRPAERRFLESGLNALASLAEEVAIPDEERTEWARQRELGSALLDDPDHYYREGNVVARGIVPEGPSTDTLAP
jgi:SAM-dependent methyltransferase